MCVCVCVCVCDLETSITRRTVLDFGCGVTEIENNSQKIMELARILNKVNHRTVLCIISQHILCRTAQFTGCAIYFFAESDLSSLSYAQNVSRCITLICIVLGKLDLERSFK